MLEVKDLNGKTIERFQTNDENKICIQFTDGTSVKCTCDFNVINQEFEMDILFDWNLI